ncbi:MAG TPA: hypothetical protein VNO81_05965 [Candidatus Nitrosotenuis sp.]|nr:hypothetical protein [Candidatus Nitrosotenuis sp.]
MGPESSGQVHKSIEQHALQLQQPPPTSSPSDEFQQLTGLAQQAMLSRQKMAAAFSGASRHCRAGTRLLEEGFDRMRDLVERHLEALERRPSHLEQQPPAA